MLPAQVGGLIQSYTKWGLIRSVSQKLKQCKLVGQIELAQAANNVHEMKGSFIGGSADEFQDVCDEVSTGYTKGMDCFIKKNGSMNEGAVKSWILKFNPIDEAVQKWDFSSLTWFAKWDTEHEDTKGTQKEVSVMESLVCVASTRAREVDGILDLIAWDTKATNDFFNPRILDVYRSGGHDDQETLGPSGDHRCLVPRAQASHTGHGCPTCDLVHP